MPNFDTGDVSDLSRFFRVQRLFSAVGAAFRPGTILTGVFLVLLLGLGGRAWDGLRGRVIDGSGLLAPVPTDGERTAGKTRLMRIVAQFVPRADRPAEWDLENLDPIEVRAELQRIQRDTSDALQSEQLTKAILELERFIPRGTWEATSRAVTQCLEGLTRSVVTASPLEAVEWTARLVVTLPVSIFNRDRGFLIFFGVYALLVLSVGGGAMSRMAACGLAGRGVPSPADAMAFAFGRWPNFFLAVLLPPLFVGGLFLVGGVAGLLMGVPGLNIVASLLYVVALFFGFLAAFVSLMWIASIPLSTPAGACDGADAVEANQRSVAFVLRRPMLALGYLVAGLVAWALGMFILDLFAAVTVNLTAASGNWLFPSAVMGTAGGMSVLGQDLPNGPSFGGTTGISVILVDFWKRVVMVLVAGGTLSLFTSISTAAYLCLRNACDEQPFDDLWDPELPEGVRRVET